MSSPPSTHGSPSLEDNAKRKREEKDSAEKSHDSLNPEPEVDTVPPKKIKPEDDKVTKAEVKQIRKNLKTMPLEDANQDIEVDLKETEDMDAESDVTSTVDSPRPDSSKLETEPSTADQTPVIESAADEDRSSRGTGSAAQGSPAQSTSPSSSSPTQPASATTADTTAATVNKEPSSALTSVPKEEVKNNTGSSGFSSGGFGNTSSVSPFANVKPSANIFGSGSSTLAGTNAASNASPFATMTSHSSPFLSTSKPSGFGNTSSVSPFGTVSTSTSVFGSTSSPSSSMSSSEQKSGFPSSGFGNTSSVSPFGMAAGPSASGSIFGVRSTIGSSATTSPLPASTSTFGASNTSTNAGVTGTGSSTSKTFGTFGALSKDATGSFLDAESTQGSDNFDALLTQETEEGNPEDEENNAHDYTSSQFIHAEQIDVVTGEEGEATLFQTKGRLYADADKSQSWKERGKGTFKVNVGRNDTKLARLVMRTDGALRLILNIAVFAQMTPLVTGEKYVRFIGIEDKKPIAFLLKVKDNETAQTIITAIERAQARQKNGREQGVVLKESDE